ncbi:Uma2 family endonuclease [Kamptonema animale CS-326]|jgi:Uma2 family endonuclease|uniref:Uma2 family endonuclease n=1 Tax=Kamptonema animale TaxID=92934 RepID=UPI00232D3DD1|nr:Uma2 family endonuclease [Kamptonema animale]MDB9512842.1 Uma2 family endonuclease [Kamptonema animale CS-326]
MLLLDPQTLQPAEEQRVIFYELSWEQYEQFSDMFGREFSRMTYLEGTLEIIMTNSPEHERLKKIIARLIEAYAEQRNIELNGYGSTTFRSHAARRGAEPDECYCLGTLHEVPDIAIEIVLSSGGVDKLEVYGGLGVREVWFWENQQFSFYYLPQLDADYVQNSRSVLLPDLDPILLASFVGESNQTQAVRNYKLALIDNNS